MKYLSGIMIMLLLPTIAYSSASNYDTSFNPEGIVAPVSTGVTTQAGTALFNLGIHQNLVSESVAIQSDGKIVITGYNTNTFDIFVVRYLANGLLDTIANGGSGFGDATPADAPGYALFTDITGIANSVAIDPLSGNIVITGDALASNKLLVIRYLPNGTLDTSFNGSGSTPTPGGLGWAILNTQTGISNSGGSGVIVQPNSDILAVGSLAGTNGIVVASFIGSGANAGQLNTASFNTGDTPGYITAFSSIYSFGSAIGLQSNGNIIITGEYLAPDESGQLIVLSYTPAGTLNTSFGPDLQGYVALDVPNGSGGYALTIVNDIITVVGRAADIDNIFTKIILARFLPNGSIDTSFNEVGYVLSTIDFSTEATGPVTGYQCTGVGIQASGDIVICGIVTFQPTTSTAYGYVSRYNPNGSIDTTFTPDESGSIVFDVQGGTENLAIAIQPDQKIVTTGFVADQYFIPAIVRFLGVTSSQPTTATSPIAAYGYNSAVVPEFLYVDSYAAVITNPTVQAAAIADVNDVIATYQTNYANQPNFNYISYLYLMNADLAAAQAGLLALYPASTSQINQFFIYLQKRINILIA